MKQEQTQTKEIKGFLENQAVVLSLKKYGCLDYDKFEEEGIKTLNMDFDLSTQIINIKGFKNFLRSKDIEEFRNITGTTTEDLSFNGLTYKKDGEVLRIYLSDVQYNNKLIVSLNLEYIKSIFREYKINDLNSIRIFIKEDYPAFFEININEGFLIAPRVETD